MIERCYYGGCERVAYAKGLCKSHRAQQLRGETLAPIRKQAKRARATGTQLDLALLLIARGASVAVAAEPFGLSAKQLRTQLIEEVPQAWADAKDARWARPHGNTSRYRRGCRCWDCITAIRVSEARNSGRGASSRAPAAGGASQADQRESWRNKMLNDHIRDQAKRLGYVWTGPELEMAARRDLSARQIAVMLGRSVHGVRGARRRGLDPKWAPIIGRPRSDQ